PELEPGLNKPPAWSHGSIIRIIGATLMQLSSFLNRLTPRHARRRPFRNLRNLSRPLRLEQLEDRLAPSRTITSVTLDGASNVSVNPGSSITVVMDVTTASPGNANWRSSGWLISTTPPGTYTIVNHADHDGAGNYTETFTITAPTASGTYNAYFAAFGNNAGTGNAATFTLNNSVIVLNTVPTANAGGPYTISEGDSLTLDASASSDPD